MGFKPGTCTVQSNLPNSLMKFPGRVQPRVRPRRSILRVAENILLAMVYLVIAILM